VSDLRVPTGDATDPGSSVPSQRSSSRQVLRPAFEHRYGPGSVHVRNLDRRIGRLRHPGAS
jgi:hypothetical protein